MNPQIYVKLAKPEFLPQIEHFSQIIKIKISESKFRGMWLKLVQFKKKIHKLND